MTGRAYDVRRGEGRGLGRIEALTAYAGKRELALLEVAIAGLAAQPAVGSVIAGATSGDQVRANAAALRWEPTPEDLAELDTLRDARFTRSSGTEGSGG